MGNNVQTFLRTVFVCACVRVCMVCVRSQGFAVSHTSQRLVNPVSMETARGDADFLTPSVQSVSNSVSVCMQIVCVCVCVCVCFCVSVFVYMCICFPHMCVEAGVLSC